MPLDPRVKRFLDALAAGKPPNALETTVEERRLGLAELMKLAGPQVPVGRVEDRTLPGPAGALGIRIYTPLCCRDSSTSTAAVWWREPWRRMTPLGGRSRIRAPAGSSPSTIV